MILPNYSYSFKDSENKWRTKWQQTNLYSWISSEKRENTYVVDTPPPTVSGNLHMGHVFSYTHTDIVVRFQRMMGKNIFYPMGFDDNGLPTERLVEKKQSVKATKMRRSEFVKLCKETIVEEEESFRQIFKKIGLSVDWSLEYQTINDRTKTISQMSFLDLVEKDHIYRKDQPMLWDVVDQTALAQAEVEDKESKSYMNDIVFKTSDGEQLIIATTRPELLPACVAVFFNPNDDRYKHLRNKTAISPLFEVEVPILEDEKVSLEKGSGLVMCCTFGDTTDIFWWKKHNLPLKTIITKDGRIDQSIKFKNLKSQEFTSEIIGLKIKEAREKIIHILKSQDLLIKQIEVNQVVKCAERSGAPLEILSTPQWFIKTLDKKEKMLELSAKINWHPESMKIKLDTWIESLSWDWCISRQRFFGVPIPAWYSKRDGEVGKILHPNKDQLPVDPLVDLPVGYTRDEVEADSDVFDTWATSSVSPQISSGSISENYSLESSLVRDIFPADLRPQSHEIIRVWAFGTILKAHLHSQKLPFDNIMISGWCLASDKTKMSKSKGNIVTPKDVLEKYGSDVVRYWAASCRLGSDYAYSEDLMLQGKKFVNKLFNAAKFASSKFDGINENKSLDQLIEEKKIFCTIDLWIVHKLKNTIDLATNYLQNYEYSMAKDAIEKFFMQDFCDNYLEIIKIRSYNDEQIVSIEENLSCIYAMHGVLRNILRVLAPFIPFVTEELYNLLYSANSSSVHVRGNWPALQFSAPHELILQGEVAINALNTIRKYKSKQQISIKTEIEDFVIFANNRVNDDLLRDIKNVTNSSCVKYQHTEESECYIMFEKSRIKLSE